MSHLSSQNPVRGSLFESSSASSQEPVEILVKCCVVNTATGDVVERPYPELRDNADFISIYTARGLVHVWCADFYQECHAVAFVGFLEERLVAQGISVINRQVNSFVAHL